MHVSTLKFPTLLSAARKLDVEATGRTGINAWPSGLARPESGKAMLCKSTSTLYGYWPVL